MEGVRGNGIAGDIALDDITFTNATACASKEKEILFFIKILNSVWHLINKFKHMFIT